MTDKPKKNKTENLGSQNQLFFLENQNSRNTLLSLSKIFLIDYLSFFSLLDECKLKIQVQVPVQIQDEVQVEVRT